MTYAEIIRARMEQLNITIRSASATTGYSYEHIRKVVAGKPVVSRHLSDSLANMLQLDADQLWTTATKEKVVAATRDSWSGHPKEMVKTELTKLAQIWCDLDRPSRREIIRIAYALHAATIRAKK